MPNPVMRWQIVSPHADRLVDFYSGVFGWEVDRNNALRAAMIDTGTEKGIPGAVWPAPPEAPTFMQLFIEVEDCAASIARATELGASVLVAPQTLPDGDVMAILKDPSGMSFGVFQAAA